MSLGRWLLRGRGVSSCASGTKPGGGEKCPTFGDSIDRGVPSTFPARRGELAGGLPWRAWGDGDDDGGSRAAGETAGGSTSCYGDLCTKVRSLQDEPRQERYKMKPKAVA